MVDLQRQSAMLKRPPATALIIGAGAIGSNAAYVLASVGVQKIHLYDFDYVEAVNLAPQLFGVADVGYNKAVSVALTINRLMGEETVIPYPAAYEGQPHEVDVSLMAVDSMRARRDIFTALDSPWVIDARMGGTMASVYTINKERRKAYVQTMRGAKPLPCGMQSTAFITKGWIQGMIGQVVYDLSNMKVPPYYQFYDAFTRAFITQAEV